ncbi:acyl-coenzyme A thioesterase 1 isoform X1 [Procambarus clarkii]|uniref:acyl-coenzyme A thioesterase 1 isoform X1 n=1 Tax=Procambarus clarkii TaxID=6728 RepID=UPI001E672350|nr:acyl-coenzyme A thioesterase 1-like isoform X2 [Procambarus clarkii]XP_045606135.1 acyl-coenzyme A thioesterase 1-like isoform X2 [Procambarus clarkii]XP_045606136.1 acyl-coenzyme A thioesterase 1-like isoform X2 [Procambarus clarkii]
MWIMYKMYLVLPRNISLGGRLMARGLHNVFSASSRNVELTVKPVSCLHDEPVSIKVSGLGPDEYVTLHASMNDSKGLNYMSYAHYRANVDGLVDLDKMESVGGRYRGVFPMGLIGTLMPALCENQFFRFTKKDIEYPNVVTVTVYRGHLSAEQASSPDTAQPWAAVTHLRHYMGLGVQRIPVRYGKVRGCLFLPPGDGPFPGVIDMYGTGGGLMEHRSAQLASRGFASLALAYFHYDDLPKYLDELHISYFEEAVEFMLKHDKVLKPHLGSIGLSKGADLVLSLATYIPEVKAVVWINGCNANVQAELHLHDETLPALQIDASKIKIAGVVNCSEALVDPQEYPNTIIPIEEADAHFLFIVGCEDQNWDSEKHADQAVERLRRARRYNYEVLRYPRTGHLLEPPYSPFCYASYHKLYENVLLWGGIANFHVEAQAKAWKATLAFLHKHLDAPKEKL